VTIFAFYVGLDPESPIATASARGPMSNRPTDATSIDSDYSGALWTLTSPLVTPLRLISARAFATSNSAMVTSTATAGTAKTMK